MPDEKQLSTSEVRKTIATALAAAFGFIIALMWNNVVVGAIKVAGVSTDVGEDATWMDWGYLAVIAVVLTVVMVILIVVVSRWGKK